MQIACLIPARYNSSRFPGKLLATALGKTVLQRTIESALDLFTPENLFIAVDDEKIAKHVKELGIYPIWTDPRHPNGTERIIEAIEKTPALQKAEVIVNIQGDHPCLCRQTIQAAIDILLLDEEASMSTVATPLLSLTDFLSPHVVKVVTTKTGDALYFSRSPIPYAANEKLPKNALHHIGLYCYRKDFLLQYARMPSSDLQMTEDLEQLKALQQGYKIKVAVVKETAIGIDTPGDLAKLIEYLKNSVNYVS